MRLTSCMCLNPIPSDDLSTSSSVGPGICIQTIQVLNRTRQLRIVGSNCEGQDEQAYYQHARLDIGFSPIANEPCTLQQPANPVLPAIPPVDQDDAENHHGPRDFEP